MVLHEDAQPLGVRPPRISGAIVRSIELHNTYTDWFFSFHIGNSRILANAFRSLGGSCD